MARNQRRNRRNKAGSSNSQTARGASRVDEADRSVGAVPRRSSTETKSSLKTTELIAYAGAVLAVVMTALALDEDGRGGGDPFGAEPAIRYITYLTIGYMVARGLAKSGSHENRVEHDTPVDGEPTPRPAVVHDDDDQDRDADRLDVADETVEADLDRDVVRAGAAQRAASEDVDARP